jgi:hypothetical protein
MTATTRRRSSHSRPSRDREVLLEWVERVAMYFNEQGLAPITGRILGWLLACDPPEQSGGEISKAIGASRASIATNVRLLTAAGPCPPSGASGRPDGLLRDRR